MLAVVETVECRRHQVGEEVPIVPDQRDKRGPAGRGRRSGRASIRAEEGERRDAVRVFHGENQGDLTGIVRGEQVRTLDLQPVENTHEVMLVGVERDPGEPAL